MIFKPIDQRFNFLINQKTKKSMISIYNDEINIDI